MKNKIIFIIIGFIVFTAFNKPTILISDYRDSYTGIYFCKKVCNTRSNENNQAATFSNDTVSIIITKDIVDSVMQINFGNQVTKVKLQNKNLQAYPKSGHYGGQFFANDSIKFIFADSRASSCSYRGKKK